MKKLNALMPIGSRLSNSCTFISKNKRFLFVVLSLALLEISFLRDFIYFEKTGLDPSWMWAMNNIFALFPERTGLSLMGLWGLCLSANGWKQRILGKFA